MSEFRRRARNTVGAVTLVGASLVAASCSTGGEGVTPNTTVAAAPETTVPNNSNESPEVLPKGEQEITERANELWKRGIQEIRDRYKKDGKLEAAFGVCMGWNAYGGRYTAVANPAFYQFETATEIFSFPVFTVGDTDQSSDSPDRVTLMNGPYQYAQKDSSGNAIPGTIYVLSVDIEGTPANFDLGLDEVFSAGEWRLEASQIGEGVSFTKVFETREPGQFEQFCSEHSALTVPIMPEGQPA